MAACGRVDFSSDDENVDKTKTSRKCRADGRLLRDAEATDAGLVYGTLACNEVCGDEKEEETSIRGGRVEVDVTCAPGEACAAGEVRRFAAGASADARRKQSAASDAEVGLFPNLDVETIVAEATAAAARARLEPGVRHTREVIPTFVDYLQVCFTR